MLGLLLMAGLGFAATAIMEHVDEQASTEDDHPDEVEDTATAAHGSLLDEPDAGSHVAADARHGADDSADHPAHPEDDPHAAHDPAPHETVTDTPPATGDHPAAEPQPVPQKFFGTDAGDTLRGSDRADLMDGNGGDDLLLGGRGRDHLVSFDAGQDTIRGGAGADSLHGYTVQHNPDGSSFVVEDHEADHLAGGLGKDVLSLGSGDIGTGGKGEDAFHVSWDVEHGHPAQITDYDPAQDKIYVEYSSHHANAAMDPIKPSETTVTTQPMKNGAGTAILINGEPIAHVLGATDLKAADIGLIHA